MTEPAAKPAIAHTLRTHIATPRRDIFVPIYGGLMRPTDDVLIQQGGGKGLKVYDEIERDPLAYAVLTKRKLALVARDWELEEGAPTRISRKALWLAENVLAGKWGLSFDKLCLDLQDATLKGYAVGEILWDIRDGWWVPVAVKPKNQRRFVFDEYSKPRMLTWEQPLLGEELPDRKFLVHRFGDKDGDPYGRGLGHQLFWWVYFKRMAMQFWLTFGDKFGSPTVVGELPQQGMSDESEIALLERLAGIAQESAILVPFGTKVAFLEAMRSGSVTYPELVRYCDEQITLAVLGQTLTTSVGDSGSRALGDVHASVEAAIVSADADLLSETVNTQLLTWLTLLNFEGAVPPRVRRPAPEREEDVAKTGKAKAEARTAALEVVRQARADGWEPEDTAADIEEQAFGKWVWIGKPEPAPEDADLPPDPEPAGKAPTLAAPENRTAIDDLVDQVDDLAAPALAALVDDLAAILDAVEAEGGSLTDVLPRLMDRYPAMDITELASVVAGGLAVADLTGRAEVADADRG